MPPFLFLAIVGAAGYAGYKLLSTLTQQAARPPRRDREMRPTPPPGRARDLGELEWDESARVYRPRRDRETS